MESPQRTEEKPINFFWSGHIQLDKHATEIPEYKRNVDNYKVNIKSSKMFDLQPAQYLPPDLIRKTNKIDYIKQFEQIAGSQNLFPILLQISNENIYICSKDCFICFDINRPKDYEKVKLPEMPTAFRASNQLLYFGLKSGSIIIYNIKSKTTLTTIEQFSFPILQIQVINKEAFFAMDILGNLKSMTISITTFRQRIVKVSSSSTIIIQQFRIKKRDKIKSFVKSLPFRKQEEINIEQAGDESKGNSALLEIEKSSAKFCFCAQIQNLQVQDYQIIYYFNKQLKSIVVDKKYNKKSEFIIIQDTGSSVNMLQFGEGGFVNSNQSHKILVLSIQNKIIYFRQIIVQDSPQYIKVNQHQHRCKILDGKFLSNNILVYLTEQGIQIGNVSAPLQFISKVNLSKFSYIDFFIEQEGFEFEKKLLYRNILKVGSRSSKDCYSCCLEGKRIVSATIYSWVNYLNQMADEYEWQKCIKSALMIYNDKITLLGDIPENVEERNDRMKVMFQKIALSYLTYSLKNSQQEVSHRSQIIKNVIDFMVRTDSFSYLFSTIYQCIKVYGHEKQFFESLDTYVQGGTIKQMPEKVLDRILQYYSSQIQVAKEDNEISGSLQEQEEIKLTSKRSELQAQRKIQHIKIKIQTLIMNFDLTKMEKPILLSICLQNQLYLSLIQICISQSDFVTPVMKLCGLRILKGEQLKKEYQKDPNSKKIKFLLESLQKISTTTFSYIKQCLLGHLTEHNNIKSYNDMLNQLISFIFIPQTLIMLLQISPQRCFQIVHEIFGPRIMQHVLQNQFSMGIKKTKYFSLQQKNETYQSIELEIESAFVTYFHAKIATDHKNIKQFLPLFLISNSPQFQTYNNLLTIVVYAIIENFQRYHSEDRIIRPIKTTNLHSESYPVYIRYLISQSAQSQKFLYQCHRFITYLILTNSFPIRLGFRIISFQFLISYPLSLGGDPNGLFTNSMLVRITDSIIRQIKKARIHVEQDSSSQAKVQKALQYLLNSVQDAIILRKLEILYPIKCYILDILNRPKDILKILLTSKNQAIRQQAFFYISLKLHEIFNKFQSIQQQFLEPHSLSPSHTLISAVFSHASLLISISLPQTLSILVKLCQSLIESQSLQLSNILQLEEQLCTEPEASLSFLEEVMKSYNKYLRSRNVSQFSAKANKNLQILSKRHLQIVLKHKKDSLEQYVLRIDYPLEQAYRVCEQANNKTAMAYVLIKSGRNLEGVLLICELFSANSRKVFSVLAKKNDSETSTIQSQIEKMTQLIKKIIQTCTNQFTNDISRGQQMWQKVSEKLFKELNIKGMDSLPIQRIRQLIQKYVDLIIKTMFAQVSPEFFLDRFSKNNKLMIPTRIYLQAHSLINGRLDFQYIISSFGKQLLRDHEMKLCRTLLKNNRSAYFIPIIETKCSKCSESLNSSSRIASYKCQHHFHKQCEQALLKPNLQREKDKQMSPTKKSKKKTIQYCPVCEYQWETIYNYQGLEAERYSLKRQQRKRSTLIQKQKKLMQFDQLVKLKQSDAYLFLQKSRM